MILTYISLMVKKVLRNISKKFYQLISKFIMIAPTYAATSTKTPETHPTQPPSPTPERRAPPQSGVQPRPRRPAPAQKPSKWKRLLRAAKKRLKRFEIITLSLNTNLFTFSLKALLSK